MQLCCIYISHACKVIAVMLILLGSEPSERVDDERMIEYRR